MSLETYHLRHTSKRAVVNGIVVRHPRHFVAYRVTAGNVVEIIRILHESMDIPVHLSDKV